MRRKLSNLAAALSLVLFVATAALWVRSYFATEDIEWCSVRPDAAKNGGVIQTGYAIAWGRGSIALGRVRTHYDRGFSGIPKLPTGWGHRRLTPKPISLIGTPSPADLLNVGFAGFQLRHTVLFASLDVRQVAVPCWFLLLIAAIVPAMWGRRWVSGRVTKGRCPNCGYDLRATPERCPECGTVATAPN